MSRTLVVLFRRDPSRDRHRERVHYRGYCPYWPDGRRVDVGLDAFCQHGQRLLGLNRHLARRQECLIQLINFPVANNEENIRRIPGHRVRRFFIERRGETGRLHFMDGTPTDIVFDMGQDEKDVLHWIGLPYMRDGERQWFDLAACPADMPVPAMRGSEHPRSAEKSFAMSEAHQLEVAESAVS